MIDVRDYSHLGEQAAILEWADGQTGSFVDLGAYDGERYSNTAALADLGWRGICVDAAPDAAAACAERYADRDDVTVVLAAFADEPVATIHWSPGAMYSSVTASRRTDTVLVPILIPRLDLEWFKERIRELPGPLFCSVDLEGSSVDALHWLHEHADPACVCVEANTPRDQADVRALLDGWVQVPLPGNNVNVLYVAP